MGNAVDLTGQRFGKLVVINKSEQRDERGAVKWICQCDCGNTTISTTGHLKCGDKKSCGCSSIKLHNLIGQKFGKLTVVERDLNKGKMVVWKCRCDCGNLVPVYASNLRNGNTKSCGCASRMMASEKIRKDLCGKKFGKLLVLNRIEGRKSKNGRSVTIYKCLCDCGRITEVSASNLKSGHTSSCGCNSSRNNIGDFQRKHGMSNTRLHMVWQRINERCHNANADNYLYYGGRGIEICEEWSGEHGFENFAKWSMSHGYSDDLSIDRINVNGNYEPSNCRWITHKEQCNNRRNNRIITYRDESKTLAEWCDEFNLSYGLVRRRLNDGWSVEEAFFAPKYYKIKK